MKLTESERLTRKIVRRFYSQSGVRLHDANAEFIVRACNSYDELVEALEAMQKRLRDGYADHGCDWTESDADVYEQASAALAKAKGETSDAEYDEQMDTLRKLHTRAVKDANDAELCYGLLDSELADPSVTEVTPIIIKRGEMGYYKTDWSWIKKYAVEALDKSNAKLGVDPETAERMKGYSMFGWPDSGERQRQ